MENSAFHHVPVLAHQILELLDIRPGHVVVDTTAGGGGHLALMAEANAPSVVIGIDRDERALVMDAAGGVRARLSDRVHLVHARFSQLTEVLSELGIYRVDRILCDLGVSSEHLDNAQRGFSFLRDGPLDMRMTANAGMSALELIRALSEEELANVIFRFGEERFSRRIARVLKAEKLEDSTVFVANLIAKSVGRREKIHPATRTFQALRIAVNGELSELCELLNQIPHILAPEGRAAIISFHSLEDRLIKHAFRKAVALSKDMPKSFQILTKKPVIANEEEVARNSRARSAKLRVLLKKSDEDLGEPICDFINL